MNYLFYLGHPAHFHLFKNAIRILKERNHDVQILIKKKDVLEDLVKSTGWKYANVNPRGRSDNKFSIALALLYRDFQLLRVCMKVKPDLMMGTSAEIAHIGKVLGIKSIVANEDDYSVVPLFTKLTYPFAYKILSPECCDVGKWKMKKIGYAGYHELAYLHPQYFSPDEQVGNTLKGNKPKYFILRFAKLGAHHDKGKTGITTGIASEIIKKLLPHGNIYISSERELEPEFEKYRIRIKPEDIHSALYYAEMYIGDSQTMAAEAAVLGTPALRFNDFVGRLGYLEELEHKHQLTFGVKTNSPEKLFFLIEKLLAVKNLKDEWNQRKQIMILQTADVTALMVRMAEEESSVK